jgi:predicted Fe-S protein YdhL (DUF1289 family)
MVESPCIDICEFETTSGLCKGCKRTGFEIFNWINFDESKKKEILFKLKSRNIPINTESADCK